MIPSKLVIDGLEWTIEQTNLMSSKDWGETRIDEGKILLNTECSSEACREMTFWHELVHALFKTRDFTLNENATADELEEQVASFLGPALCSFFWSNASISWSQEDE